MPKAIILANSEVGTETKIVELLADLKEIEEVYMVYGVYDIVIKIHADTMEILETLITQRIRRIPGIRSTLTLIVSRQTK